MLTKTDFCAGLVTASVMYLRSSIFLAQTCPMMVKQLSYGFVIFAGTNFFAKKTKI